MKDTLDRAYRQTEYWVVTTPPICLRIDAIHTKWAALQRAQGVEGATLITAHNPASVLQSPKDNAQAQQNLALGLKNAGWSWVDAVARHPSNGWPEEPMLAVWGMSVTEAKPWAERFGQNAVVCLDAEGWAHLRWMA